jgi:hypothetical protein
MAWKKAQFRLTGVSPLILHNGDLANPLNPIVKEQKKISGKRGKTEADLEELARLEFIGGIYYSNNSGVILPAEVLEAAINGGARKFKEGMSAKAGLVVMEHAKLEFDGDDLTPQELYDDKDNRFKFQKMVTVSRARILRTRPIFNDWSANIEVTYEDTVCDTSQVYKWLKKAGEIVGLCDWRPRYGRFSVEAT